MGWQRGGGTSAEAPDSTALLCARDVATTLAGGSGGRHSCVLGGPWNIHGGLALHRSSVPAARTASRSELRRSGGGCGPSPPPYVQMGTHVGHSDGRHGGPTHGMRAQSTAPLMGAGGGGLERAERRLARSINFRSCYKFTGAAPASPPAGKQADGTRPSTWRAPHTAPPP